ncbi:MAG: GTPase HflX [candidate division NC10 bacterium]|nr:GTPase HflX [candidate division NC10 bacterium]
MIELVTNGKREVALLIGIKLPHQPRWEAEDSLDELELLAKSAGAEVRGKLLQERSEPDPRYFIGHGKALEVKDLCLQGIDLVIVDEELSGSQQRNLETIVERKVVDRTGLILDIFAHRARTREGKLQVELAQLTYLLPRLVGRGVDLSRTGGGIGTRGPGETKLEKDRRTIRQRVAKIREVLVKVRKHRALLRKPRRRFSLPTLALVGYTNAGKSTLFNTLTHASVPVRDQLFATLDPTLRRVRLPNGRTVLLSDTVGFIRKLPPQLIDAFKATLEEVVEADLLLHVIDASHPQMELQRQVVEGLLAELGIATKPIIEVYNKIDKLGNTGGLAPRMGETGVAISAKTGEGVERLLLKIQETLVGGLAEVRPFSSKGLAAGS